ncbi:MAG: putative chemoreceptor glutamine deamidase CheD [Phycisphaerae bacterium]|nr:MAG: putative chemoreceptor glutamine deamidase CheD [Phycisphaerae bacterium]
MDKVVDIADLKVAKDPNSTLVTYSLGSCIGVAIWDPKHLVGGMLHYMLPESTVSPDKAKANPAMFADTGIPALFRSVYKLGAMKANLVVKIAGGAQLLDDNGTFNIGKRNYVMLRKLFWKNKVMIDAEQVGGSISRTVRLNVGTGRFSITSRGQETVL